MKIVYYSILLIFLTSRLSIAHEDKMEQLTIHFTSFTFEPPGPHTLENVEELSHCRKLIATTDPITQKLINIIGPTNINNLPKSSNVFFNEKLVNTKIDFPTGETIYIDNKGVSLFYGRFKQGLYSKVMLEKQDFLKVQLYLELICGLRPPIPSLGSTTEKEYMDIFTGRKDNYLELPLIVLREPLKRD